MGNDNKNTIYVEANVMNIYAKIMMNVGFIINSHKKTVSKDYHIPPPALKVFHINSQSLREKKLQFFGFVELNKPFYIPGLPTVAKFSHASCPLLSKILAQPFITVVNWVSQLCPFLNACCLPDRSLYSSRWAMIFEHTMCSSNLQGTQVKETGRYLHASDLSLFLKRGQIFARDHFFGISPVSIDGWKRWADAGPNSVASSFRTLWWSSSDLKALEGFKPLKILITPSLETTISFMKGADLSRSGTWVCSFLLNTTVNWPLNSSAFSRSDWATPFPFFLFRGWIHWMSFFWLLMYRQKSLGFALTSPTKLFTYKSRCFLTSALNSLLKFQTLI